jgi:hypothetical protein
MAKQKRATANVKMTYSEDADLIAWWNSLPRGSRNAVMKDMMREYLERHRGGYRPLLPRNVPQPFDPGRFGQLCDDTAWMRAALVDLPRYVEQVIHYVIANGAAQAGVTHAGAVRPATPSVDDAEASKREAKVRQAKW